MRRALPWVLLCVGLVLACAGLLVAVAAVFAITGGESVLGTFADRPSVPGWV